MYVQCGLHVGCIGFAVRAAMYVQPSLKVHSVYWSVSAVCTAGHRRYTAVRSGAGCIESLLAHY